VLLERNGCPGNITPTSKRFSNENTMAAMLERECCSGNITPTSKRFQNKTRWRPPDYQTPRVVRKERLSWEYYAHFKAISNENKMAATLLLDSTCCEKGTAASWEYYAHFKAISNENKMAATLLLDSTCCEKGTAASWEYYAHFKTLSNENKMAAT
jgi:hypothetical protein